MNNKLNVHIKNTTKYINLNQPFKTASLGIFKIKPTENQEYKLHELNKDGFPLERLVYLEKMSELIVSEQNETEELDFAQIEQWVLSMCIRNS